MSVETGALESWQKHVMTCSECGNAKSTDSLCQTGKNFWRVPGSVSMPVPEVVSGVQGVHTAEVVRPTMHLVPAKPVQEQPRQPLDLKIFSQRVAERVVARTSSGHAIAIPLEKTSSLLDIQISKDVQLRMPERDIEVYSAMKTMIRKYMDFASQMGTYLMAMEQSKQFSREQGVTLTSRETAMVVVQVGNHRGMGNLSAEAIYNDFCDMTVMTMKLGDHIARFMAVDAETRVLMKEVRALGVEMQGEIERSAGSTLVFDEATPRIVRQMRMLAVSLQGEMERRLGT
jgi:hypothetical protein